jgi:conjugal transfer pilus assembly protein TraV
MTRSPLLPSCATALGATTLLAACTNMSGLSGSSSFACKAPDGVTCDSVSGTYANAVQHSLPSQRSKAVAASAPEAAASAAPAPRSTVARAPAPALSPDALRSSARVLRLWFKPWEDADRDLYDQGYVYVQIDSGRWLMDHVQRQIRDGYAPLRAPPRSTTSEPRAGTGLSASPGNAARVPAAIGPAPGTVPLPVRTDSSD